MGPTHEPTSLYAVGQRVAPSRAAIRKHRGWAREGAGAQRLQRRSPTERSFDSSPFPLTGFDGWRPWRQLLEGVFKNCFGEPILASFPLQLRYNLTSKGIFGPEVPRSVRQSVPRKLGCPRECAGMSQDLKGRGRLNSSITFYLHLGFAKWRPRVACDFSRASDGHEMSPFN